MIKFFIKNDLCVFSVEVKNEYRGRNWCVVYIWFVDVKIYGKVVWLVFGYKVFVCYFIFLKLK